MLTLIAYAATDFSGGLVNCGKDTPCTFTQFIPFLVHIVDFLVTVVAFPLTVLGIAVSGAMLIFGGASEQTRTMGKDAFKASLIGFIITLGAWLIVHSILYYLGATDINNPLGS